MSHSWYLLNEVNKWAILGTDIECFAIAILFFLCAWKAARYPAYSQIRSFVMTTLGFWFATDGIVKLIRFLSMTELEFSAESMYAITARIGTVLIGLPVIYGLMFLYKGIKKS